MLARRRTCTSLFALTLAAAACDPEASFADAGEVALRPGSGSGILYDSAFLGDWSLNKFDSLGKKFYRGARLRRICLDPDLHIVPCLDKIVVDTGHLIGSNDLGTYLGPDLVGSRWDVEIDLPDPETGEGDGVIDSTLSLRLVGRDLVDVAGGGPLELVDFRIDRASVTGPLKDLLPPGDEPLPLCAPDPARAGATAAAVLGDVAFDPDDASFSARPNTLHLACTSAALGRATTLGYRPETVGLDGFEAIVRALVGDYCGTGQPLAAADDAVSVADVWKIRTDHAPQTEARWGRTGALCLDHARRPDLDAAAIRDACGIPTCDDAPTADAFARTSLAP